MPNTEISRPFSINLNKEDENKLSVQSLSTPRKQGFESQQAMHQALYNFDTMT
jgi:hypothetical protein